MARLSKRTVDALQARSTRYIEWDDQLSGFGCRVSTDGKRTFIVDYVVLNKRRRMTLGRYGVLTVDQARGMAKEALAKAAMEQDPMERRDKARADISLSELCDRYLAEGVAHKRQSTIEIDRSNIESHIKPTLGTKPVATLDQADIRRFYRNVTTGKTALTRKSGKKRGVTRVRGGAGTANRALAVLSAILSFAVSTGLRADNPARGVKPAKLEGRERFLSGEEMQRLAATMREMEAEGALHPYSVAIIRLLLFTGARRGEIVKARWRYVDLERGVLLVPMGKTGRRHIRLAPPAVQILADLPRVSDWVFPASSGDNEFQGLPRQWNKLRARAGLDDLRLHDLRHTFASLAVQGGASLYLVQNLLGHADASMTQRYAHLADDPVAAVNNAVANRVADLFSAQKSGGEK